MKEALRPAATRMTGVVYAAIGSAVHNVTPEDIVRWFQHRAAYAFQKVKRI